MKKSILALSMIVTMSVAGMGFAHAQYIGPTDARSLSVKEVLDSARDDAQVQMTGKIIKQIHKDKYLFDDGTGQIQLDINRKTFKSPVDENTTVVIRGEVDKDYREATEIDVDTIIVKQE